MPGEWMASNIVMSSPPARLEGEPPGRCEWKRSTYRTVRLSMAIELHFDEDGIPYHTHWHINSNQLDMTPHKTPARSSSPTMTAPTGACCQAGSTCTPLRSLATVLPPVATSRTRWPSGRESTYLEWRPTGRWMGTWVGRYRVPGRAVECCMSWAGCRWVGCPAWWQGVC